MARMLTSLLLAAALLGGVPNAVAGQLSTSGKGFAAEAPRSVDYFVSHYRLAEEDGERLNASGAGARVMWSLAPLAAELRLPLLSQVAVGGYVVHTLGSVERREVWHYGMQTDLRLTPDPLAGRLDPIFSLGLGAMRAEQPIRPRASAVDVSAAAPPESRVTEPHTATHLSLAPGIGARLRLLPGLNLRTDLRPVLDLRDEDRRHLELSGGISVTL